MSVYADTSLFALGPAVGKLPWNCLQDDAQRDSQSLGAGGLLLTLPVTVGKGSGSNETIVNTGQKSLPVMVWHGESKREEWSERQDLNLRQPAPKAGALPS